ncbi:MAG TPA: putative baseplate assembly protein [Rubrobacteraceae bacterium]|nr:putative baseplate assembly protein [Rubrobacteraceae bacterium]
MTTPTRVHSCNDERRRAALSEHDSLMGIDFLEVSSDQRSLFLHFVPPAPGVTKTIVPPDLTAADVGITGGGRVTRIEMVGDPVELPGGVLRVDVRDDDESSNGVGDFSPYTLRLEHDDLDPLFSEVTFSFKVECPSEFDCAPDPSCPVEILPEPELDYLAKDYASFRRLMLDRLSVLMPDWEERNPADLQITLVELLAYVGDYLSYQQDAVATEAYLGTARRRVSARRHARLVDYFMHDGCNARAWTQVLVRTDGVELPKGTRLLTRVDEPPGTIPPHRMSAATSAGAEVFETMHPVTLYEDHNALEFYTWGDRECCLPKGTTRATLRESLNDLEPGDFLLFEEVRGPRTGAPGDADPKHRHAVRLTRVTPTIDPLGGRFAPEPNDDPVEVTEIEWHPEDGLPFPLCVSARTDEEHGRQYVENVSVALGNIVLADHGLTIEREPLGSVPDEAPIPRTRNDARPGTDEPEPIFPRFRPPLERSPLTQAAPFVDSRPATSAVRWDLRETLPQVRLSDSDGAKWLPGRDLLESGPATRRFVAEIEADGRAFLRFGDDTFGLRPARGTGFTARYRVGNGVRGNVGADAISYVVTEDGDVLAARNPIAAGGGVEPESIERVRQNAPSAFRVQERAVTPEDYAEVAQRHPQVQRAAATVRWTGSWYTIFLTVDRFGGRPVDADFEQELRAHLEQYRLAGHDLEVDGPRYVPLEVEMMVCVLPEHFRSDVKAALLEVLGNRNLPDGRRGLFHPDNFTFGQPVHLSRLYEAAQGVEGVDRVEIPVFGRQGAQDERALLEGRLTMHRLEIVRLDNDPNFPENGVLRLVMEGGK